jgi:cyclopropane-fatty-acyl-phospholipid synthase
MITRLAKSIFHKGLPAIRGGALTLVTDTAQTFGDPHSDLQGVMAIADDRFFTRALALGDIGIGESYMDGDWTSPDLVALIRVMLRNLRLVEDSGGLVRAVNATARLIARRLRDNSIAGSRRHIQRHYDLGNEFFRLFLDSKHLLYSCAYYRTPHDTLEKAQEHKLEQIGSRLDLSADDRVLEIGSGWGGFAVTAAKEFGARVTSITISRAQAEYARARVFREGLAEQVEIVLQDYRDVKGRFDRIASIEMFEAVGERFWPAFFQGLSDRLNPQGRVGLQLITIADRYFDAYRRNADFIQAYIFPGGMLPSPAILHAQIAQAGFALREVETFGASYALTLGHWLARFEAAWPAIEQMGFPQRFKRMWEYYLSYCEAGFRAGSVDVGLWRLQHRC